MTRRNPQKPSFSGAENGGGGECISNIHEEGNEGGAMVLCGKERRNLDVDNDNKNAVILMMMFNFGKYGDWSL
jgi:hypothetical protein